MSVWTSIRNAITSPLKILTGQAGTESAERDYEVSRQSAQSQMDFQERMSNTSYQRAVEDLRAAGLNPLLAVLNGGASTPSGAGYESNFVGGTAQDIAGLQTLIGGAKGVADIKNTNAQTDLMNAQTDLVSQQTAFSAQNLENLKAELVNLNKQGKLTDVQTEKVLKEIEVLQGSAAQSSATSSFMNSLPSWAQKIIGGLGISSQILGPLGGFIR